MYKETIFGLLFFIGIFVAAYLWIQFGRFLILLISNDFCWEDFKDEWKEGSEGIEEVLYLCWVIVVPIQIYYKIKDYDTIRK